MSDIVRSVERVEGGQDGPCLTNPCVLANTGLSVLPAAG